MTNSLKEEKICKGSCKCPDCHVLAEQFGLIDTIPKTNNWQDGYKQGWEDCFRIYGRNPGWNNGTPNSKMS